MSGLSGPSAGPHASRFLGMPASVIGRSAASLSLVVVASVVFMATVVEPAQPAWRYAFGIFVVATVVATAAVGLAAVILRHERSWAVVLPTLVCIAIMLNEVIQQATALFRN